MPKVELDEIRLGVSPLTDTIYAGTLTKSQDEWRQNKDVTADFWKCVVERLSSEETKSVELRVKGSLRYTIQLVENTDTTPNHH